MKTKQVKMIKFRKMGEGDYDGFQGASDEAIINDTAARVHFENETLDAVIIIDKGAIEIDCFGENEDHSFLLNTGVMHPDCLIVMLSFFLEKFGGIPRQADLEDFGFQKLF
jgi:hypothetical protein